ncbi:hypothetical protein [Nannocystis punicea]|uniref:Uncharacterized protein n=1 Tax=Nannocystis punicea TaxID=2995304 RepID=A0ABY7GWD8_9BACT|nr:hypothetical protein [Nannocystis poenicansa]WAS91189.1 hypothetical protein O0S08_33800 [Nannocystis poenicansa]
MRTSSLAILVLVATSACRGESTPQGQPVPRSAVAEPVPDRNEEPPQAVAEPRADVAPEPHEPLLDAGSAGAASSTATDPAHGLAVAWFDSSLAPDALILLCDSTAPWVHNDLDSRTSCVPDGQAVHVLDPHGLERWSVRARERQGRFLEPELVRPDARYPAASMPVLVMTEPPRASNPRLVPLRAARPSNRTRAAASAVASAAAAAHGELEADLPLTAKAEIHGTFGGGADTVAVFQVGESAPDLAGHQVLAALSQGKLVGLFDASPLAWSGYELVGATDLEGDGHQELLWWAVAEGVGIGLNLTYFSDGEHKLHNLFACECGLAFRSAYPRRG